MATPAFGKTWWGEQWLNALTHIDYDNRLPRGLGGSVQASGGDELRELFTLRR
ncbi:hypothetical protein [Rhodocyclus purpureus]|uniref:hypothetical protein n=1 Tax=Rhodocyclus purpureus TaxID=1067 RepID=UPI001913937E|nr:hypothetical protein [Rhodocyclus purpureus]